MKISFSRRVQLSEFGEARTTNKNCCFYRLKGRLKSIAIFMFLSLMFLPDMVAQHQVSGTVNSKLDNDPLPGISIQEKGTQNGTITDIDGNYVITVADENATLIFSFIGMITQEIILSGTTNLDVVMEEDVIGLEEVIAIGYGTIKKSDLTGSVGSVDVTETMKTPVTSLDQSLQGRVAGVQIVQLSAQPGGSTMFRVRGSGSIYAGNEPLYIIDGMQVNSSGNFSWLSAPTVNALSSLNPGDIERIEILKDASATSIYGARGANGVVLITTKKGKEGTDKISFQSYYGIQQITKRIEVMNATDYAMFFDEAGRNAAADEGLTYTDSYPDPESLGEGTDWQEEIYRVAPTQNHSLSFMGGNSKTRYLISTNFYDQKGVIVGSDFRRYSVRANIDHQVNNRLTVGTSFTLNKTESNVVGSATQAGFFPGVVNTALTISPTLPIKDSTGQYTLKDPDADAWLDNPVAVTREVKAIDNAFKVLGNIYANYAIMDNLKLNLSVGLDEYYNTQDYYNPSFTYSGSFNSGQARYSSSEFTSMQYDATLNFDQTYGEHSINVLAGFSFHKMNSRTFTEVVTGFANDRLGYYGIGTAENMPTVATGFGEEGLISYLGRVNYSYASKYLVSITNRIDGSSKFGPNNRFATFPSLALAWRISSEDFMAQMDLINNLKLRTSVGISGNDAIPSYLYDPTMVTGAYYFGNSGASTGFYQEIVGNDDLKWETTRQIDVGIDLSLMNNRINFVIDYYNKYTYDLLYSAEVPYTSGFETALINVGTMVNNGVELTLNTVNVSRPFVWNTDLSFSFNKNRITDLKNNNATYIKDDTYKLKIGYWSIIQVGEELGSFYGYEADGIWQSEEAEEAAKYGAQPGDFKYVDQNTDFKINEEDRKIIGYAQPDFICSLNNTLTYKGFELSVYLQGVYGNDILNSNRFELESGTGSSNASIAMLDRWTPERQSNIYPRANRKADYLHMSDRYLEDGSYLRLQLLSLAYSLPQRSLGNFKISSARVYISAKNLFTLTNYSGFDPEVGRFGNSNIRQGYDLGGYPSARTFLLGFSIDF